MIYLLLLLPILIALLLYWLLITTEGVFLGQRMVTWLYDVMAHKYDQIKAFDDEVEEVFVVRPLFRAIERAANKPASCVQFQAPHILDVATGSGRVPYFVLNDPSFNGRIVGLDISRPMLDRAAAKLSPFAGRTGVVQGTAVSLPFASNHFDAVTCLEALEFFPSDTAALREMVRVLKPGGVLMTTRRRGWEGKLFLQKYRETAELDSLLRSLGLEEIQTFAWQVDYDQVVGRKREP